MKKRMIVMLTLLMSVCVSSQLMAEKNTKQLRSSYRDLNPSTAKSMIQSKGFYDKNLNKSGNFSNDYQSRTINGDKVVIDRATGLMWHQSGAADRMTHDKAKAWVQDLNSQGYAGYKDWRLPTLEEGASLLESSKSSNGLYIDAVFSGKQWGIWTGDTAYSGRAWYVYFNDGYVTIDFADDDIYVRPVRSGQ